MIYKSYKFLIFIALSEIHLYTAIIFRHNNRVLIAATALHFNYKRDFFFFAHLISMLTRIQWLRLYKGLVKLPIIGVLPDVSVSFFSDLSQMGCFQTPTIFSRERRKNYSNIHYSNISRYRAAAIWKIYFYEAINKSPSSRHQRERFRRSPL